MPRCIECFKDSVCFCLESGSTERRIQREPVIPYNEATFAATYKSTKRSDKRTADKLVFNLKPESHMGVDIYEYWVWRWCILM